MRNMPKKQIETFVFNQEINKYESTEDQVQKGKPTRDEKTNETD